MGENMLTSKQQTNKQVNKLSFFMAGNLSNCTVLDLGKKMREFRSLLSDGIPQTTSLTKDTF